MNDASHRGPGLGRGWEKMRMQYHESIISQQAVATYVPLALWLAAWARRRGPPWEGDLRVEYERHPPRNAATSGLVPPAGEGAFLPLASPVQYHGTPNTAIAVLSASAAFSYGGTW